MSLKYSFKKYQRKPKIICQIILYVKLNNKSNRFFSFITYRQIQDKGNLIHF